MTPSPGSGGARRSVFLDRDGTLIREREYLSDPAEVELLPGAAVALKRLADAGLALVVVTNQSGIARGYFGEEEYRRVKERVESLLGEVGVRLDGAFHCPHHPDVHGLCDCRKPETGLFRRAAQELDLDLRSSWFVGDRVRDVLPAAALEGRGLLVLTGYGEGERDRLPPGFDAVPDLRAAAERILTVERRGEDASRDEGARSSREGANPSRGDGART